MDVDETFCRRCGHTLAERDVEGKRRRYCPGCGYVAFLDPKVAAVVLATRDSKLVLVRRDIEPAIGKWSLPSGYVDRGEAVEDTAVREVKEETGLDITLTGFVGLYSRTGSPVVLAAFAADVIGGAMVAGPEVQETALFPPDRLPALPFPRDDQILDDWRAMTAAS